MPYSQFTFVQVRTQISKVLDDVSQRYWTGAEINFAIFEALRYWGGLTNYWRTRGTFNLTATPYTPFYDLSVQLPTLRTRSWTLNNMAFDIRCMLLEPQSGAALTAPTTGQTSIDAILNAVQRARNRFVLDVHMPVSVNPIAPTPPPADGLYTFPQSSVFVHRASWQDQTTSKYTNLWREDAWAFDHYETDWTLNPGPPIAFSESENSPLKLQIYPPPLAVGSLEVVSVDSLLVDITNPNATFNVPDEWVHAIKYSALFEILAADSQINDPLRAQYCEMRYQQYVAAAQDAASVLRVLLNGVPLPIDSFAGLDAADTYWRNKSGKPYMAGVLYDFLAFAPNQITQAYPVSVDVAQSAPLPFADSDAIQIGDEDLARIIDFCIHILLFKCGGNEFKATFSKYDDFMSAVKQRGQINEAKISYLSAFFGQVQKEERERPDQYNPIGAGKKG